jgi:hypothetical protein
MKLAASLVGVIISASIALGGCATGGPSTQRIDGSTQENTNKSLKQMSASLSSYDLCRLKAAILRIQIGDTSSWKAGNAEDNSDPLGAMINGMTFPQIIDLSLRYPDKVGSSCMQ